MILCLSPPIPSLPSCFPLFFYKFILYWPLQNSCFPASLFGYFFKKFLCSINPCLSEEIWSFLDSPYRTAISGAVLKMQEDGRLHMLKEKWWKEMHGGGSCNVSPKRIRQQNYSLTISNIITEATVIFRFRKIMLTPKIPKTNSVWPTSEVSSSSWFWDAPPALSWPLWNSYGTLEKSPSKRRYSKYSNACNRLN